LVLFSQIMDKISFKDIKSLKLLSGFLGTKEEEIDKYLNQNDTIFDTWIEENMPNNGTFVIGLPEDSKYRFDKMYIPKKRNKNTYRIVYKVQDEGLKSIHKIIQKYINENYNPQNCVHGFVSEKNVATNAAIHLSKKLILKTWLYSRDCRCFSDFNYFKWRISTGIQYKSCNRKYDS